MLAYLGYVLVKSKLKYPPNPGNLQAFELLKISVFKILHYLYKYVHFRLSNVATSGTLEGDHVTLLNINVIFTMLASPMTY